MRIISIIGPFIIHDVKKRRMDWFECYSDYYL